MTAAYGPGHPRLEHARRFAVQLQAAMDRRRRRPFHVFKALGGGFSSYQFGLWLSGGAVPRLELAARLAGYLEWPALLEIARAARTSVCERPGCGRAFVTETGRSRKYCSARCRQLMHEYYQGSHVERKASGPGSIGAELARTRQEARAASDELAEHRSAVEAMCRGCEPDGICRTPECALRTVSPLPLRRVPTPSRDKALQRGGSGRRWGTMPAKPPIRRGGEKVS